jgi:protein-S-isoprenylcysteine O-methyltransferase Ste14
LFLSFIAWFVFIPIDVFHLQLLPPPHFRVSVFGAALFLTGFGIIMTALFQNAFAVPIVRDQSERGQVLIDAGLYGRIRHPMYFGFFLFLMVYGLLLLVSTVVLARLAPASLEARLTAPFAKSQPMTL